MMKAPPTNLTLHYRFALFLGQSHLDQLILGHARSYARILVIDML
ncbi:MAG: hypothetical protein N838_05090 [Thiohalocapsa sp. PB-PSB1]|nr:MAG: hypothetical protein N838_05090 [Thiohalocapsa sp. PB-PSB1]